MKNIFTAHPHDCGVLQDYSSVHTPAVLYGFSGSGRQLLLDRPGSTYYVYVHKSPAYLVRGGCTYTLLPGMYACVPGDGESYLMGGSGIAVEHRGHTGMFVIGGPVEPAGRLKYIDGCTDTLLIPPTRMGEPCLNALYFPQGIDQTMHTHPSIRVGMVASGHGTCITPHGEIPLYPGMVFTIYAEGLHRFRTDGSPMTVIAWHPDSDFGPTDESHPMINRTMVAGVSASAIPEIRTK